MSTNQPCQWLPATKPYKTCRIKDLSLHGVNIGSNNPKCNL